MFFLQAMPDLASFRSGCRPPGVPLRGVLGALRPFAAQMGFGESAPVHAGALPLHPTGDRDAPRTPAIVEKQCPCGALFGDRDAPQAPAIV